ncbi:MAG TPA: TrbI/VirB10 family protein, partial [Bradyrhizobium sp.]|nr:TrbI/VirB10 family protein [Bradyrhizobium sp.]
MVSEQGPQPVRDLAAELRLRPERPPVTRLSRKVLMALFVVAVVSVSGALIWALSQGQRKSTGASELYSTENKPTPDGLSALPRDYTGLQNSPHPTRSGVPALGPPLLGDIGRPNKNPPLEPSAGAEQQRIAQETEAALTSRLFATTSTTEHPAVEAVLPTSTRAIQAITTPSKQSEAPPIDPNALINMQDRKLAFLTAAVDRTTVSPNRLTDPPSRYVVQAGAVIPAALITGIRSDLPGQVTAQVTENVYDSPTGNHLLIPQGAKLIGDYDSQVSFGQDRVLLVWTRLILPNGRSIVLERQPGADTQGFAGLEDEVDYHWGRLFEAAALSTLLGVGSELGATNNDNAIVQALRQGSSNSLNQTGQQVVGRNLNVQPTITIRPGFPVRVIVNRDLVLAPYRPSEE